MDKAKKHYLKAVLFVCMCGETATSIESWLKHLDETHGTKAK